MGKNGYDPQREQTAAYAHELGRQPIASPAECAEGEDEAELVALDEIALRFQSRGMGALAARQYAREALAVMAALDREACGGRMGSGEAGEKKFEEGKRDERRRWVHAVSQVWAWPDSRAGVWAVLFVNGQPPEGVDSMRKIAAMREMSVENVNNMVDGVQGILELPRTHLQKSAAARDSYQRTNGAKG